MIIKDNNGTERFYMNDSMYNFCKNNSRIIKEDDTQVVGIIFGKKGSGKSVLAQHIGFVIDPTLEGNISRVCMRSEQFREVIVGNRKKVAIADEGVSLLYKRNVMTREGRDTKEFFEKIRCFNNCILICVPTLADLDKDLLLSEDINFVVSVWEERTKDGLIKGNYRFYPNLKGNPLATRFIKYHLGEKNDYRFRNYKKPPYAIQEKGNLVNKNLWLPVGNKEYRELKIKDAIQYANIKKKEDQPKKSLQTIKKEIIKNIIVTTKKKNPELTDELIAKVLNYSSRRVHDLGKEGLKAENRY